MRKYLLTDSSGNKSTTLTAFVLGFFVVNIKLIFSGVTAYGFTFEKFSGTEYAAALAALGAIYVLRRSTDPSTSKNKEA